VPRADELGIGRLDTARRIVQAARADEHDEAARRAAERARDAVIPVDSFDPEEYAELRR